MHRHSAVGIAHRLLTDALTGKPAAPTGLDGDGASAAFAWLRDRAAAVIAGSYRNDQLMVEATSTLPRPWGNVRSLSWQHACAVRAVRAELLDRGGHLGASSAAGLSKDPEGVLRAMADVAVELYRLHDGEGAPALVRALHLQVPSG